MRSKRMPAGRRGLVTFEWILVISLLAIGIIGGMALVRGDLLSEYAQAVQAISQVNAAVPPPAPAPMPTAQPPWDAPSP